MTVEIGQPAPDFTLASNRGRDQPVSLSDFRGQPVVLVFVPMAFSPTCEGEYCSLRDDFATYEQSDAQLLGVSVDNFWVLKAWAEQNGFQFPLLSDFHPKGEVARRYGVYNSDAGFANRGTFIIDPDGIVRDVVSSDSIGEPRDADQYKQALARLS